VPGRAPWAIANFIPIVGGMEALVQRHAPNHKSAAPSSPGIHPIVTGLTPSSVACVQQASAFDLSPVRELVVLQATGTHLAQRQLMRVRLPRL